MSGARLSDGAIRRLKSVERRNRRRAADKGCEAVEVDFIAVCEAQGWHCYLCGEPMDPELAASLPIARCRAISLEHSPALGIGGAHRPGGVHGAHLCCNLAKGREADTRAAAKVKRMAGETGQAKRRRTRKAAGKHRPIPSRKLAGGGFSRLYRKKMNGRVERREDV